MKIFNWNNEKNEKLKQERNISFEDVVFYLEANQVLDIKQHQARENQKVYVIEINNYAYLVPFVEHESEIFLKTIMPSRKATKEYLRGENNE